MRRLLCSWMYAILFPPFLAICMWKSCLVPNTLDFACHLDDLILYQYIYIIGRILTTFAYEIQIRHALACWNPPSIVNDKHHKLHEYYINMSRYAQRVK
jgi:hypothetical protein